MFALKYLWRIRRNTVYLKPLNYCNFYMRIFFKQLIYFLLICAVSYTTTLSAQEIDITQARKISSFVGDEINAFWLDDSNLCFQHHDSIENSLYAYNISRDSLYLLFDGDFRNPVLHPDKEHIVFDTEIDSSLFLFKINMMTGKTTPLFHRKIKCKNAAFSDSDRQVYFTGFDINTGSWEIYSYDFIYDNLNKLTNNKLGSNDVAISANGKNIVYCKSDPFTGKQYLEMINWYGESIASPINETAYTPTWNTTGFKMFFVAKVIDNFTLFSIWKNGTHRKQVTASNIDVLYPAVSPDESKVAVSVLDDGGYDIYILELP